MSRDDGLEVKIRSYVWWCRVCKAYISDPENHQFHATFRYTPRENEVAIVNIKPSRDEFAILRERCEVNAAERDYAFDELAVLLKYTRRLAGYPLGDPNLLRAEAALESRR